MESKDNPNKLVPSPGAEGSLQKSGTGVKVGLPKLMRKVAAAEEKAAQSEADAQAMPNRLVLMLDDSGSMSGTADGKAKIDHLKDAVTGFLSACNWRDTSVAINSFVQSVSTPLDWRQHLLAMQVLAMETPGDTPIAETLERCLMMYSMTRGILVSDGGYTGADPIPVAKTYAEAQIPVDCVHIGRESGGEATLRQIAEITGGVFIKFDNVANFARSLKYLSPAMYGILTSGGVSAAELGASEVK